MCAMAYGLNNGGSECGYRSDSYHRGFASKGSQPMRPMRSTVVSMCVISVVLVMRLVVLMRAPRSLVCTITLMVRLRIVQV